MKSLAIMVGVFYSMIIAMIIVAIVVLIKKPKQYVLTTIVCIVGVIVFVVLSVPYCKDISKQETNSFVGTYVKDQAGYAGRRPWIFTVSGKRVSVETCRWISDYNNYFEEGRKYKVTYYVNTRMICKVELVE